jgi:hypothetical protein
LLLAAHRHIEFRAHVTDELHGKGDFNPATLCLSSFLHWCPIISDSCRYPSWHWKKSDWQKNNQRMTKCFVFADISAKTMQTSNSLAI